MNRHRDKLHAQIADDAGHLVDGVLIGPVGHADGILDHMTEFLFDSGGNWIAYRVQGCRVWSKDGNWIGWCPWDNESNLLVRVNGDYLGHILDNRLLRKTSQPYLGYRGYPGCPGYPGYPGYPGFAGYRPCRTGYTDVPVQLLEDA